MVEEFLQIRIDPETKKQLDILAKSSERTMSAYVRWLIRQAYENNCRIRSSTAPLPVEAQDTAS